MCSTYQIPCRSTDVLQQYVYHRKPPIMVGDLLIPLNTFQQTMPELYIAYASKYKGREELLDLQVPKLNCKWNDVLHLTPIHPALLYQALTQTGHTPQEGIQYYEIPVSKLDASCTVVFHYTHDDGSMTDDQIQFLTPTVLSRVIKTVPSVTLDYYKECMSKKCKPASHYRIPHILTMGSIDVSKCRIITATGHIH